jgi:aryl-alcohol dehydrogenase-like predicted oxidoreductase
VGLGTYSAIDHPSLAQQLSAAVQYLVTRGCNVIDTAPNYADGNAESAVGDGIAALQACGAPRRDELFVATKAGIVPPSVIGPLAAGDIDGLGRLTVLPDGLCFDPAYLRWQVERSRQRLGLETVDCLFLHNLDAYRLARGREECRQTFARCVETLEELVSWGWMDAYGVSAWSGFRQLETAPDYLALADLCAMAQAVAGFDGHFRFIQAPIGLWAPEAILLHNQTNTGTGTEAPVSLLRAARDLGLTVIANGSLLQGELVGAPALDEDYGISDLTGPIQAIQFSRSIPGVTSVLVGMTQPPHWEQNASLFALPKADLRHLGLVRRSPTVDPAGLYRAVVGSRSGGAVHPLDMVAGISLRKKENRRY